MAQARPTSAGRKWCGAIHVSETQKNASKAGPSGALAKDWTVVGAFCANMRT